MQTIGLRVEARVGLRWRLTSMIAPTITAISTKSGRKAAMPPLLFESDVCVRRMALGVTVGVTLLGVVLWGTLSGSMLPMLLKKLGADPAVSSAPFVATLVDVTGLVIYFSVAFLLLSGTLL